MSQLNCFTCSTALATPGLSYYYTLDSYVCSSCDVPLTEKILCCLPELQNDMYRVGLSNIRICTPCCQNLCKYYRLQAMFIETMMDGIKSIDSFSTEKRGIDADKKNLKNDTNTEEHQDMSSTDDFQMSPLVLSEDDEPTTSTVGENTAVYVCGICGRLFNKESALNLHFEDHTYENIIMGVERSINGIKVATESLKEHRYQCQYCGALLA